MRADEEWAEDQSKDGKPVEEGSEHEGLRDEDEEDEDEESEDKDSFRDGKQCNLSIFLKLKSAKYYS